MSKRTKRTKEIEEQLAHVRWLKLQNERAIQTSLQSTKLMEQNDKIVDISSNHASEKSSWVQSVIKSEMAKPLVVSDYDISRIYAEDERTRRLNEDKYRRQDEAAQKIIHNLSGKMEFNESTKMSLERNYEHIVDMQKQCDDRYRKQWDHNHSIYERRERMKIESKKGQSRQIGPKHAKASHLGLSSPSSPF